MIAIRIKATGATITGHADKTKPDHALVCCAVSTALQGFVIAFGQMSDKPLSYTITDGDAVVDWGNAPDSIGCSLIEALYIVLAKLAADNPEHIVLED